MFSGANLRKIMVGFVFIIERYFYLIYVLESIDFDLENPSV